MTVMVFFVQHFVIYFCDVLSSRARARAHRFEARRGTRGGAGGEGGYPNAVECVIHECVIHTDVRSRVASGMNRD